jgi:hypothetical protein
MLYRESSPQRVLSLGIGCNHQACPIVVTTERDCHARYLSCETGGPGRLNSKTARQALFGFRSTHEKRQVRR